MQARGKWMIPAFKMGLYTSLGCSMYMMVRLVLVSSYIQFEARTGSNKASRDTRLGLARTRLRRQEEDIRTRPPWIDHQAASMYKP